jgi:hypothetical protein
LLLTTKPLKELNFSLLRDSLKLITNSLLSLPNTENHTEPKLSSNSDLLNSLKLLKKLLPTPRTHHLKLESINSLTTPKANGRDYWDTEPKTKRDLLKPQKFLTPKISLTVSTGELKEPSLQLKTKDNVDHAGLSPPLVLLKELNSLPLVNLLHYLNNNSLIAQHPSETKAAMEVLWTKLSNTLKQTHLNLNPTMHTLLLTEPANTFPQRELVKSHHSLMLLQRMPTNLRQLLHLDQFQLQLKLTELYSNLTLQESSLANVAELALTTESSPSDMELKVDKITSSLKTHGVLHGEIKDTSKSEQTMSAVSS